MALIYVHICVYLLISAQYQLIYVDICEYLSISVNIQKLHFDRGKP